jgi:C4-dicarboxylate-specific signal transduction histidine kinase
MLTSLIENLVRNSSNTTLRVGDMIEYGTALTQSVASSSALPDLSSMTVLDEKKKKPIRMLLQSYDVQNQFASLYIIGTDGVTRVSTDPSFEGKNYGFRKYFTDAIEGKNGYDMVVGVTTKEPGFYFSAPIKNASGQIQAVFVAKLRTASITRAVESRKNVFAHYMIVSEDGVVLLSNEQNRVFTHLSETISSDERARIEKHYLIPKINFLTYGDAYSAIKTKKTPTFLTVYDALEKEEELLWVGKIGSVPYYFVSEQYTETIDHQIQTMVLGVVVLQIVGLVVLLLILYRMTTKLLEPIQSFEHYADTISKKNFDTPLEVPESGEFHTLGVTMKKMSSDLKFSYETLNEEVAKKTRGLEEKVAELKKMNDAMINRELKMIELKKKITELESKQS